MSKRQVLATRKAIGPDYVGMGRLIEGATLGIKDSRVAFIQSHTKRERKRLEEVEVQLVKCASILRTIGNRMEQ